MAKLKVRDGRSKLNRTRLLVRLGVTEEQLRSTPQITPILKKIGGAKIALDYLRASHDPDARKLIKLYDEMAPALNPGRGGKLCLRSVPIEAYCIAAQLTTRRVLELIAGEVFEQSGQVSELLVRHNHVEVVQATLNRALEKPTVVKLSDGTERVLAPPCGDAARKMIFQHSGFLPVPKTQVLHLHAKQGDAGSVSTVTALPPIEDGVRRISDRFNTQMPAPAMIAAPDPTDEEEEDD
jgi:hypothetical protein